MDLLSPLFCTEKLEQRGFCMIGFESQLSLLEAVDPVRVTCPLPASIALKDSPVEDVALYPLICSDDSFPNLG